MSEKNMPKRKSVSGRVSISLWSFPSKGVQRERACLQHSRKDQTGKWVNQQIWLSIEELRDLATALDQLNGEEQSSPSSLRVNYIIGYIQANSLDAGLDVLDLEEMSVPEVLREYGIRVKLTSAEERMVREELRELAEQKEFAESAYMAQCDPFLALIPELGVRRSSRAGAKFHSRGEVLVWLSRFGDIRGIRRNPASA